MQDKANRSIQRGIRTGLVYGTIIALVLLFFMYLDLNGFLKNPDRLINIAKAVVGTTTPEDYARRYSGNNFNARFGTIRSIDKDGVVIAPGGTFKWADKVVVFKNFKEGITEARFVDKENLAAVLPPGLVVIAYPQKGDPLIRAVELVTGGGWTYSTTPDPKKQKTDPRVPSLSNTRLPGPAR